MYQIFSDMVTLYNATLFDTVTWFNTTTVDFSIKIAVLAFIGTMILDIFYALYTIYVNSFRPGLASFHSGMYHFLSMVLIVQYVENPIYIPSIVAGAVVGTFATVWWRKFQHEKALSKTSEKDSSHSELTPSEIPLH